MLSVEDMKRLGLIPRPRRIMRWIEAGRNERTRNKRAGFIYALAGYVDVNTGQVKGFTITGLARGVGVTRRTARAWLRELRPMITVWLRELRGLKE